MTWGLQIKKNLVHVYCVDMNLVYPEFVVENLCPQEDEQQRLIDGFSC